MRSFVAFLYKNKKLAFVLLLAFFLFPVFGVAKTATWVSEQNGQWNNASYWEPEIVPKNSGDSAYLGQEGFGADPAERVVSLEHDIALLHLTFGSTSGAVDNEGEPSARNYLLAGPGELVFKSNSSNQPCELQAFSSGVGTPHTIAANVELSSPLDVSIGDRGRRLIISGNIRRAKDVSTCLNLKGEVEEATLELSGENQFEGGIIEISGSNILELNSPNAARGAIVKFTETDGSNGGLRLTANTQKNVAFLFQELQAESDGLILLQRKTARAAEDTPSPIAGADWGRDPSGGAVVFPSIVVRQNRVLQLKHYFDFQDFVIAPQHAILLEDGSRFEILSCQDSRTVQLRIGPNARLGGTGSLVSQDPPNGIGKTRIFIDAEGVLAPGSIQSPGSLHIGGSSDSGTRLLCEPQSRVVFRLNGMKPGLDYDQILLNGDMVLDEAELETAVGHAYSPGDMVFLVVVESGTLSGTFLNLREGSTVNLQYPSGKKATAKISYSGDLKSQSISGGKDIVLHDFAVGP